MTPSELNRAIRSGDPDDTDASFFLFHPLLALKTKYQQIVATLDIIPPFASPIEDIHSIYEAYVTLVRRGVLPPPSVDWFPDDPLGLKNPPKLGDIPEHHNE